MWPDNTVLIIISALVFLVHSLPPNIILNTVRDDSNSVVQNERYLQLFLQLATRTADNLISLRNQADKNHDCNQSRDNLLSTIEDSRIQSPLEVISEQFDEIQNEIRSHLFSSNFENKIENTSSNAFVHDEVSSSGIKQKSIFNSNTEEATTSANKSNPDAQSSENSTEVDDIAERFFNSFNLQNINTSTSINEPSDRFKNKFLLQTSNLARPNPTLERSERLYNKINRTSFDAVEHNDDVFTSSQKSIFKHSDEKSATTNGSDSNSDAQNSESSEVDEIGERFFNPFNLQTPHVLINNLTSTGKKVLAQTHNLLQSTLERSERVNNTLCLQNLSSKLDDVSDVLDLSLDKIREYILNPQVTNNSTVLHQIVSSAINVVNSVIEKLPSSFSNATLFKQIIPHNLEKLQASLNDTNLFDRIISHNLTNTPLQIAEKFSEDISKSGLEFISALRSQVNELSSHGNQNIESKVTDANKTNVHERNNQKLNTELLFTDNSKIQSNNDQSTTINHESTLASLPKLLSNFDDHKKHTDNLNGA
ncbi:uncharacterized protein LOC109851899 isoform X1 [Pseudomyrmex gracilis]|uniref:uncharacterized protein LOC109851899 isoform X1 n=1 Tax=Pseudomyrmex gracilis TaxID=219809 RepID=UPI000994FFE2|nr:uncharacterized protein LOC109851899 isoform X1 [Pseudomyrmex gracilis]